MRKYRTDQDGRRARLRRLSNQEDAVFPCVIERDDNWARYSAIEPQHRHFLAAPRRGIWGAQRKARPTKHLEFTVAGKDCSTWFPRWGRRKTWHGQHRTGSTLVRGTSEGIKVSKVSKASRSDRRRVEVDSGQMMGALPFCSPCGLLSRFVLGVVRSHLGPPHLFSIDLRCKTKPNRYQATKTS
jgi:hypothetical protein